MDIPKLDERSTLELVESFRASRKRTIRRFFMERLWKDYFGSKLTEFSGENARFQPLIELGFEPFLTEKAIGTSEPYVIHENGVITGRSSLDQVPAEFTLETYFENGAVRRLLTDTESIREITKDRETYYVAPEGLADGFERYVADLGRYASAHNTRALTQNSEQTFKAVRWYNTMLNTK